MPTTVEHMASQSSIGDTAADLAECAVLQGEEWEVLEVRSSAPYLMCSLTESRMCSLSTLTVSQETRQVGW